MARKTTTSMDTQDDEKTKTEISLHRNHNDRLSFKMSYWVKYVDFVGEIRPIGEKKEEDENIWASEKDDKNPTEGGD